ncbi:transposase [Nocardia sp. NPDC050193]
MITVTLDGSVGIDLGLTRFAVLSNGQQIASPRFLRQAERRLKKAQQAFSRKEKGSKIEPRSVYGWLVLTPGSRTRGGAGRTSTRHGLSARTKQ